MSADGYTPWGMARLESGEVQGWCYCGWASVPMDEVDALAAVAAHRMAEPDLCSAAGTVTAHVQDQPTETPNQESHP